MQTHAADPVASTSAPNSPNSEVSLFNSSRSMTFFLTMQPYCFPKHAQQKWGDTDGKTVWRTHWYDKLCTFQRSTSISVCLSHLPPARPCAAAWWCPPCGSWAEPCPQWCSSSLPPRTLSPVTGKTCVTKRMMPQRSGMFTHSSASFCLSGGGEWLFNSGDVAVMSSVLFQIKSLFFLISNLA